MKEIFAPTASWNATGLPHCSRAPAHSRAIFRHHLPAAHAHRGQREASGVEGGEGDLQARALGADAVRGRDADLVEAGDAVLKAAQPHEGVAVLDGDAVRRGLDDEGGDAALVPIGLRYACHDHEQIGDDAVRGPQLHAVQDVVVTVRYGRHRHARRVGADVRLGEQERADVRAGTARQELVLLLLGAELLQRLRYADRLMGGEQRADRRIRGADEGEGLVVVHLGEAEPAVLRVDLHAEGAELLEPVDHLVGDLRLALDARRIDLRLAEVAELGQELLAALGVLVRGQRVRMDQVEPEAAQEEFLGEAGLAPVLLTSGLGDLPGLALADGRFGGWCGHEELTSPRSGAGRCRRDRL